MAMVQVPAMKAGTMKERRQPSVLPTPTTLTMNEKTPTMSIWVTPPPRFPQPAVQALARPTISLANIWEDQNWVTTKVAPPKPIMKRTIPRPQTFSTAAPRRTKQVIHPKRKVWQRLGPHLSQRGPTMKRVVTVDATEAMFTAKICLMFIPSDCFTMGIKGAKANQHVKAMKKDIHAKWKARMWGRSKEKSWISLALKPWDGSTGMLPIFQVPSPSCVAEYFWEGCCVTSYSSGAPSSTALILSSSAIVKLLSFVSSDYWLCVRTIGA
mmetsp:Transcript_2563/g.8604  ORF Transcript_2563/g.8604 Transcript_2563/m.8604 type:complete len:268 (-) Transcript_2563:38-841(-)